MKYNINNNKYNKNNNIINKEKNSNLNSVNKQNNNDRQKNNIPQFDSINDNINDVFNIDTKDNQHTNDNQELTNQNTIPSISDINYLKKYIKAENLDDIYYQKALKDLTTGKPIQYIIGNVDFYGNIIKVNENVLIPRFETELLVDKTIQRIKQKFPNQKIDILDLGTGSGCIAISLKKELNANVDALDISTEALQVAKQNAIDNSVNINFINEDMENYKDKKYHLIISNPPYIAYQEEIMDLVKNNEPHLALYAKDNGLYYYKRIIDNLKNITNDKFLLSLEIGYTQASAITTYAKEHLTNINIYVEKDYSEKDRFIFIENKDT